MGFVANAVQSVFGGGGQGATFQAQGPSAQSVTDAQTQTNQDLANQQAFVNALNAQTPGAIAAQQGLSQQLQAEAAGQGPNPALAQLNQTTGQNVANQAALAASQRGAGANAGLIARQVAQQGAATQQQAAGQAATLSAQQQLAAQGALGTLAGNQIGQVGSAYGQQTGNQLTSQGQLLGAQGQQQASNAGVANTNAKGGQTLVSNILGGGAQGGAAALATPAGAHGGMVEAYADGGGVIGSNPLSYAGKFMQGFGQPMQVPAMQPVQRIADSGGGIGTGGSKLGQMAGKYAVNQLKSSPDYSNANVSIDDVSDSGTAPVADSVQSEKLARGGQVKAKVSPGEIYIPPKEVKKVASGKESAKEAGKTIPGKAKVKGDSLKNDTVKATLQAGGVVVPRTKNSEEAARQFVAQVMAKQSMKRARK